LLADIQIHLFIMNNITAFKIAAMTADKRTLELTLKHMRHVKFYIFCDDHTIITLENFNQPIDLKTEVQTILQKQIDFLTKTINDTEHEQTT